MDPAPAAFTPRARFVAGLFAAIIASGLVLQLLILIANRETNGLSLPLAVWRFVSYFTIQSNLLAAVCLAAIAFAAHFSLIQPRRLPLVVLAMAVVGIVYSLVLRHLWEPAGAQWWADTILHDIAPLLVVGFWLILAPKQNIGFGDVFVWLIFPFGYLVFALLNGAATAFYAYPFIDVPALGAARVALNCAVIFGLFLLLGLVLALIGRKLSQRA